MYGFVSFCANYSDEFDVWSAALMTRNQLDYYRILLGKVADAMVKYDIPFEFYFGTNEFILFDYFEQIELALHIDYVSDETADTMKRVMFMGGSELPNFLNAEVLESWLAYLPEDDGYTYDDEDCDDEDAEWD